MSKKFSPTHYFWSFICVCRFICSLMCFKYLCLFVYLSAFNRDRHLHFSSFSSLLNFVFLPDKTKKCNCNVYKPFRDPAVVAELSNAQYNSSQRLYSIQWIPGRNHTQDTNMVTIIRSLTHLLYVAPSILDI